MLRQPDLPSWLADRLQQQDFAVCPAAFTADAVAALRQELQAWLATGRLQPARIGRGPQHQLEVNIRSDLRAWLTGETVLQQQWLAIMAEIQSALNQRHLLGLVNYEAHYACYPPGAYYRRHVDSFRGSNPRRVSTVLYLNENWQADDGGQLLLHPADGETIAVSPEAGTLVVFLSELVPHEVAVARRERYSIAGWMRQREPTFV